MFLRAQFILPISAPPIADGGVIISGGRVEAVGSFADLKAHYPTAEIQDLGEVVLLPGLINAHCHLDYTGMAGMLPPPRHFADWIKGMLALKANWSYTDFAASWVAGARMLLESGTTTVADIEAVPELLPDIWDGTPLRVISLLELTGIRSQRAPGELVHDATAFATGLTHSRCQVGFSPHAPYSTLPELVELASSEARRRKWLTAIHIAESLEEFEMFMYQRGPLFTWLKAQRNMDDCGLGSPVAAMARTGALSQSTQAVHVNYLADGDAALLAQAGTSVVHCPRSHDYFQHQAFPMRELAEAGVNIALGTDSLATMRKRGGVLPRLDMFAEMRLLAQNQPALSCEEIVRLATINGARAVGWPGELGEIKAGVWADLVAVPRREKGGDEYANVVQHEGPVAGVWVAGERRL